MKINTSAVSRTDIILFNRFTCSPDNGDGNSIVVAIDGLLVSYCVVAFSIQQPTPTANHYLLGLFSINYRLSIHPQRKSTPVVLFSMNLLYPVTSLVS
jgi:hypothetical protein